MECRKATVDDIDTLVELRKCQLTDEGLVQTKSIDRQLSDYFYTSISGGSFVVWVAQDDCRIVATGGLCFYQLPPTYQNPSGRIAYVTNMYTVPRYRRQGIATMLLNLVLEEARLLGFDSVRLHASQDGRPLYRKFGFEDATGYMSLRL